MNSKYMKKIIIVELVTRRKAFEEYWKNENSKAFSGHIKSPTRNDLCLLKAEDLLSRTHEELVLVSLIIYDVCIQHC